jgi:replicative DNA helicase
MVEMFDTPTLPYSAHNETAALSCCLRESELVDEAATSLEPDDFYELKHRNLFEVMQRLRDKSTPIDVITIRDEAETLYPDGVLAVGGLPFLAGLPDTTPSSVALPNYVAAIAKKARLRRIVTAARGIISNISAKDGDDDTLLEVAERALLALLQVEKSQGGEVVLADVVREAIGEIEQANSSDGNCTGISSGFPSLDRLTTGFHKGDLFILAARPSMGKTSLAMSIAEHATIEQGIPVGVFSMEMTAVSLVKRMLSSRSGVDGHSLLTGDLTEKDIKSLTCSSGRIVRAPMRIDQTPHLSVPGFSSRARRMVARHKVELIVVDYMGLMRGRGQSRYEQMTDVSGGLKAAAKELGVPLLVLCQLSRSVEQRGGTPRLSDLRDSGSIEQDADVVALLHRPDPSTDLVEVMVQKHRNGPTGIVELEFDKAHTRFKNPTYFNNANVDSK